jgi:hypothetical protein
LPYITIRLNKPNNNLLIIVTTDHLVDCENSNVLYTLPLIQREITTKLGSNLAEGAREL